MSRWFSLRSVESVRRAIGRCERLARTIARRTAGNIAEDRIKGASDMPGLVVFKTLSEALRAGFEVYDKTEYGYLVRLWTANGWALAEVHSAN
jgi:hypothetical protein